MAFGRDKIPFWLSWLIFQLGWFLVVSGSQSLVFLTIIPVIIAYLIFEKRYFLSPPSYYGLLLIFAVIGIGFDALLYKFSVIQFINTPHSLNQPLILFGFPLWLGALWLWFIVMFRSCYQWLYRRFGCAAILGGIAGPLVYWSATHLTSLNIVNLVIFVMASTFFWGILFFSMSFLLLRLKYLK